MSGREGWMEGRGRGRGREQSGRGGERFRSRLCFNRSLSEERAKELAVDQKHEHGLYQRQHDYDTATHKRPDLCTTLWLLVLHLGVRTYKEEVGCSTLAGRHSTLGC